MIFTGLDPSAANATNRIAVAFQTVVALFTFRGSGISGGGRALLLGALAAPASALGAFVATLLDEAALRLSIAAAMVVFLVLSLIPKGERSDGDEGASPVPPLSPRVVLGFVGIGFYAGFLQAGAGVLVLLFLSIAYHVDLALANLTKVAVVLVFTLVALLVFWWRGDTLDLLRGGVLTAGSVGGAWLGAHSALRGGARFVRAVLVVTVAASAAKLLWDGLAGR